MQQAITRANGDPDLCRHMVSLGHTVLMPCYIGMCYIKNHMKYELHK